MANPFPGMDPYLEGPLWSTVHSNLIEEIARQLAPRLRPKYLALTNERVIVAGPDPLETVATRFPDVGVYTGRTSMGSGKSSVLESPLVMDLAAPEEQTQTFIEIRDVAQRRLVTAIEVLSPSNKRGAGQAEFSRKRWEVLSGAAHYVEIDLLRVGQRFPVAGVLPSVPYFVFVSRAQTPRRVQVWPIALEDCLPDVPIPLLTGDDDVNLSLQTALNTVYDLFAYEEAADHSGDPPLPLEVDAQQWALERLQAAGLRK
jgi:hypothetical protein